VPDGELDRGTLVTDKDHYIKVATVDANGKPVSRKKVHIRVYKIQWRWWWDSYDNDMASYIARESTVPILEKTISTTKGKGGFKLRVDQPEWGRYIIQAYDPESGHTSGKVIYIDWPYWARANRTENENATMLSFSTDKEVYSTGEKVKIAFPSPTNGKALVCVESGTEIVEKHWVKTTKGHCQIHLIAL